MNLMNNKLARIDAAVNKILNSLSIDTDDRYEVFVEKTHFQNQVNLASVDDTDLMFLDKSGGTIKTVVLL